MMDNLLVAGMIATSAAADVSPIGVTSFSLITYAWVFGISLLGGVVSFIQKVKAGTARAFNLTELLGELLTSGFAGVITFWVCKWGGFSELPTAACVGICGHMGSRAIFMAEKYVEKWINARIPPAPQVIVPGDDKQPQ